MKLSTEVELPDFKNKMGYRHQSLMIGSCFAENIGTYLQDLSFPIKVNPFGILYNPISIANSLELMVTGKTFTKNDLFYHNNQYHSFLHHGQFSDPDPLIMLERINSDTSESTFALKKCHHLFITFGTSWVFRNREDGTVVSNCHKLPAATFDHFRLSIQQITDRWIPLIEEVQKINPGIHLVFTVSPIRHLKDGAHENQLSKSTLLLAIDALISRYGDEHISYFPSYELVLDELRDYRFYAADMTHPSEIAIDFIREKFLSAILDDEGKIISAEIGKIIPALNHKALNKNTEGYISFIKNQIDKTKELQNKYPFINFGNVLKKFREKYSGINF